MPTVDTPVAETGRIDFLDILRGLAVLAIFAVNIKAMMAPFPYYSNATLWSGDFDMQVAAAQAFLIDDKGRTIFTALFGAGIALIAERAREKGIGSLGLLYRRLSYLAAFGLIHLLLIWMGDILLPYAICGFLAVWFRHASAKILFRWMLGCLMIAFIWTGIFNSAPALIPEVRAEIEPLLWGTDLQLLEETRTLMLGGVGGHIDSRIESAQELIFLYFLAGGHWLEMLGIMLGGMWAYRTGFLSGAFSRGVYAKTAAIGLGVAFALDFARWTFLDHFAWNFTAYSLLEPVNALDGYAGAIGYAGFIGLLVRMGWRPRPVAAAGRMAFTNYIACSLIGTTLAYGHGFGLFGSLTNLQLMGIVGLTWLAILIWSPLWLSAYRFGPLEWLWRSLTYGRVQMFRRQS